jgi:hypothetical protein
MKSEKFKSFTLFILFAIFLGFTGQVFLNFSLENKTEHVIVEFRDVNIDSILNPQSSYVSFGGSLHTAIFPHDKSEEMWVATKEYLKRYLETPSYEEITMSKWKEAKSGKSVHFVFPLEIDISNICELLKVKIDKDNKLNMKINSIIVNVDTKDKIYLGNTNTKQFIFLEGDLRDNGISYLIDEVYNSELLVESKTLEDVYSIKSVLDKEGKKDISAEEIENEICELCIWQ